MFTIAEMGLLRKHAPRVAFFLAVRYYSSSAPKRAEFRKESALATGRVDTVQFVKGKSPSVMSQGGAGPRAFFCCNSGIIQSNSVGQSPSAQRVHAPSGRAFLLSFSGSRREEL